MHSSLREIFFSSLLRNSILSHVILLITLLLGAVGIMRIPVSLFPDFTVPMIRVTVAWPGAPAKDVEQQITKPLEIELNNISQLESTRSISRPGFVSIALRYFPGQDMIQAYNDVKKRVDSITTLPRDSKIPNIETVDFYDSVTSLIIQVKGNVTSLRGIVAQLRETWSKLGFAKVGRRGLPEEEIQISLSAEQMIQNQVSIQSVAEAILASNDKLPAGELGQFNRPTELRTKALAVNARMLKHLPITIRGQPGLELADIAQVERVVKENEPFYELSGKPIIEQVLFRPKGGDSIQLARSLRNWLANNKDTLPSTIRIETFRETWTLVYGRMKLLMTNAANGLILVVGLLGLFLSWRTSFWVAMGIPIAIQGAIFVLWIMGRSLNIMSAFAFILALGVIVDDAIVVAEEAETQRQNGLSAKDAAIHAASSMIFPVLASSLTTVSAMLPLFFVRGVWADFLRDIPLVIVAVIIASLVECFLILPGHLARMPITKQKKWRITLDKRLDNISKTVAKPLIQWVLCNRGLVLLATVLFGSITSALVLSGHQPFLFYPKSDGEEIVVNVTFKPSVTIAAKKDYMRALEKSLWEVNKPYKKRGEDVIKKVIIGYNTLEYRRGRDRMGAAYPERYASMIIELADRDKRVLGNQKLIQRWQKYRPKSDNVASLETISTGGGPDQDDIAVSLVGDDLVRVKQASIALQQRLKNYQGVYDVQDDLPYGKDHALYQLRPQAQLANISKQGVGRQLQATIQGLSLGYIYEPNQSVEIKIGLKKAERNIFSNLYTLPIDTGNGVMVPLEALAEISFEPGFDVIPHADGRSAIKVMASIDETKADSASLNRKVWQIELPKLKKEYGIGYQRTAGALRQQQTLNDMGIGAFAGVVFIYIILVVIFNSYLWPIAVLLAIPLGLFGAIWGHYLLGLPISLFSLFGFFTLSGIVINDAIILLVRYRQLIVKMDRSEALISACLQRTRAVLLTSITTILGLLPILLDQSATARYFHTTATTIIFGLLFATCLILMVIPVLISLLEEGKYWCYKKLGIRWSG